ncbi:MAG TPA: hypothetical protein DDW52_28870 [Planctomycetaceae bacterium]|nr:hypothetical protein [Planctomycetaceae bacterium]
MSGSDVRAAMQDVELDDVVIEEDFVKRKPQDDDEDMDITPMIDITFLLLIFFLVTSKMNEAAPVSLPAARHGNVVAARNSVIVVVKVGAGETALVERADGSAFSSDPEQQGTEIAEYVAQQFDTGDKSSVIVRAEGGVKQVEIGRVSKAIAESLEEGMPINFAIEEQG